jgi:uncharacterized protein YcbK (DUF882 family)
MGYPDKLSGFRRVVTRAHDVRDVISMGHASPCDGIGLAEGSGMSHSIFFFVASLLSALQGHRYTGPSEEQILEQHEVASVPTWPINFYFENRHETLAVSLFADSDANAISEEGLKALTHHVRCFRTDRERAIHPRLAEIVARVAEAFGRDDIDVVSGFRARPYGAPHSKHFLGRAMDLHLPGVPSKKVAAWVWKNFRGVGVGYYPKQDFVHIDVRDLDVRWIDTSLHGESAHARYFARTPSEIALPGNAPVLAYDRVGEKPARARVAAATFVTPSALVADTPASSLAPFAGGFRGND